MLSDVSLHVEAGEIVALVGANGAGKSTLMAAVSGLVRPIAGRIALEGPIAGLPPHRIARRGLALVPEGRDLFPDMSVGENLEMGAYVVKGGDRRGPRPGVRPFPVLRDRGRSSPRRSAAASSRCSPSAAR